MNSEICSILRDINIQLQNINYNLSQLSQNQQQCNNINQRTCDNNQMFIAAQLPVIEKNNEITDIQLKCMKGELPNGTTQSNK